MNMKFLLIPATLVAVAGCQPTTTVRQTEAQNAALGAVAGAALGAAVSDDGDRTKGALIGGAVGAVAATLIGKSSTPGQCIYRDAYGRQILAPC